MYMSGEHLFATISKLATAYHCPKRRTIIFWIQLDKILSVLIAFSLFNVNDTKLASPPTLNSVLNHYERLTLIKVDTTFLESHRITGIAYETAPPIHLMFVAYGRHFMISLRPAENVNTEDATVEIHDGQSIHVFPASAILTHSVEGSVLGESNSYVFGHLLGGYFDGVISTNEGKYYIESASRFFADSADQEAIIYRDSDVIIPKYLIHNSSQPGHKFCPSHFKLDDDNLLARVDSSLNDDNNDDRKGFFFKWLGRSRREAACRMRVVADHTLFKMNNGDYERTKSTLEQLVAGTDKMFSNGDFDLDGKPDNIRVKIANYIIYTSNIAANYLLGDEQQQVETYLKLFSFTDHEGYCAAMAVTQIHFKDLVVGYAYKGGPGRAGGICYKRVIVEGRLQSVNTGVTSFTSDSGRMPMAMTTIVFAHELGHSFGSSHDVKNGPCYNKQPDKQYIMSEEANPGTYPLNTQFSECSKKDIKANLAQNGWCLFCKTARCSGSRLINANGVVMSLVLRCLGGLLLFQNLIFR